jgi:metal-responsive CopG/Arc/MetJ family transcriptional regulator
MGRPPISAKAATLYAMRLPDELIAELDAYAEREGIANRSEAVRRLLGEALNAAKRRARRESAPVKRIRKRKAD